MRFPGAATVFLNKNSAGFSGGRRSLDMPGPEVFVKVIVKEPNTWSF